MVKTKRSKHPNLWLHSFFNSQPVTVLEALYVLSGKRTKLHDKHFVYFCLREIQF